MSKYWISATPDFNDYFLTYDGQIIEVSYDSDCESPRELENLSTFVTFTHQYNSPDECPFGNSWADVMEYFNVDSIEELAAAMDKAGYIVAPVSIYEHGGRAFSVGQIGNSMSSLSGMADRWDSYPAGFMYVKKEDIIRDYGELNSDALKKVQRNFECECREYHCWANGDCYGFTIYEKTGEEFDSCWGFIGASLEETGMDYNFGEIYCELGNFKSIEECFDANQEILGIELAPQLTLSERITLAKEESKRNILLGESVNRGEVEME
jgi:hypothetical protein